MGTEAEKKRKLEERILQKPHAKLFVRSGDKYVDASTFFGTEKAEEVVARVFSCIRKTFLSDQTWTSRETMKTALDGVLSSFCEKYPSTGGAPFPPEFINNYHNNLRRGESEAKVNQKETQAKLAAVQAKVKEATERIAILESEVMAERMEKEKIVNELRGNIQNLQDTNLLLNEELIRLRRWDDERKKELVVVQQKLQAEQGARINAENAIALDEKKVSDMFDLLRREREKTTNLQEEVGRLQGDLSLRDNKIQELIEESKAGHASVHVDSSILEGGLSNIPLEDEFVDRNHDRRGVETAARTLLSYLSSLQEASETFANNLEAAAASVRTERPQFSSLRAQIDNCLRSLGALP